MPRMKRVGGAYVQPIDETGNLVTGEEGRGRYRLAATTTYFFPLGGGDAPFQSFQIEGDAAAILTISVDDSNIMEAEAPWHSQAPGHWLQENPAGAYVALDGVGWTSNDLVISASGTGVGGAMVHLGNSGACRTRLRVAVGATGGAVRVSCHGKD
ncbi:MAG: hypothetical protein ACTHU0_19120 [Kofleriaceae bacterium]